MSSPILSAETFEKSATPGVSATMTVNGTIAKSAILTGIVIASAILVWSYATVFLPFVIPAVVAAFVVAMVIIFVPRTAPYLAFLYAVLEGLAIGVISAYAEAEYPGIAIQAVSLTFATLIMMLWLYRAQVIVATERLKRGIVIATGAIAIIYLVSFIWGLSGWYSVPYIHESGAIGIGFSVFVVGIAAFNLILDFDQIEAGASAGAPKYMEWYASFGLLVTLIWLYLEILRLLSKLRDK